MRETLIKALLSHAQGNLNKHLANIEVYMNSTTGIGEHSDIVETLALELDKAAQYHDQIEIIKQNFIKS